MWDDVHYCKLEKPWVHYAEVSLQIEGSSSWTYLRCSRSRLSFLQGSDSAVETMEEWSGKRFSVRMV